MPHAGDTSVSPQPCCPWKPVSEVHHCLFLSLSLSLFLPLSLFLTLTIAVVLLSPSSDRVPVHVDSDCVAPPCWLPSRWGRVARWLAFQTLSSPKAHPSLASPASPLPPIHPTPPPSPSNLTPLTWRGQKKLTRHSIFVMTPTRLLFHYFYGCPVFCFRFFSSSCDIFLVSLLYCWEERECGSEHERMAVNEVLSFSYT